MKSNKSLMPKTITKPLYLYFESELEHLYHIYHKKGQHLIVSQLEAEIKQRRAETHKVQFGILPGQKHSNRAGLTNPKPVTRISFTRIAA